MKETLKKVAACPKVFLSVILITIGWVGSVFFISAILGTQPFDLKSGSLIKAGTNLAIYSIIPPLFTSGLISLWAARKPLWSQKSAPAKPTSQLLTYGVLSVFVSLSCAILGVYIHTLWFDLPGGFANRMIDFFTLFWVNQITCSVFLFAYAFLHSIPKASIFVLGTILFSTITSGAFLKAPYPFTWFSFTHWAIKGLAAGVGLGKDIYRDPCWQLPETLRRVMLQEDKSFYGCRCMGEAIFDPNQCAMPGIQRYYRPEVGAPKPTEPIPPAQPPPPPPLPSPPDPPADPADPVQSRQYELALNEYQDEVERKLKEYELLWVSYQIRADAYRNQLEIYRRDLNQWQAARQEAIASAEEYLQQSTNQLRWAYVYPKDQIGFWAQLFQSWSALIIYAFLLNRLVRLALITRPG